MHFDIELPDHGVFKNAAGQTVEFWLDKDDKTKCKILVDGIPLDSKKFLSEQTILMGDKEL